MAAKAHGSLGTPATAALDRAGVAYTTHPYEHSPTARSYGTAQPYGLEASQALGIDPDRVLKTLLVDTGSGLAVGVVPVSGRLDLKALAAALGVKRVTMADPADAQRATAMVVGGISPLGQRKRLPTVVDASAAGHATVLVSGGRRGLDVELAPADLLRLTGARYAPIAC